MKALLIAAKDLEGKTLLEKWEIALAQGVPAILKPNGMVRFTERVWIGHNKDGDTLIKWGFDDEKTAD